MNARVLSFTWFIALMVCLISSVVSAIDIYHDTHPMGFVEGMVFTAATFGFAVFSFINLVICLGEEEE